jgi:hypothetical protein
VTVLATTAGVLAVACTTPVGSPGDPRCASDVESVTVADAATLVPSRSLALELGLPSVLDRLNAARATDRARLRAARTGAAQARAARRLGADHRAAAHALGSAGGPAAAPLTRALGDVAAAYDTLSGAAQTASPSAFAAASTGIRRAEAVLASDVAGVARPETAPIAAAPAPRAHHTPASGGVSAIVSALLIALAVAAGAVAGSSGPALRLTTRRARSA